MSGTGISPAFAFLGAIAAAALGVAGTVLSSGRALSATRHQIFLQGELKLAEFRQAWINELRSTTAEFMSLQLLSTQRQNSVEEILENREARRRYFQLRFQAMLMMNRRDRNYGTLEALFVESSAESDFEKSTRLNNAIQILMQDILKDEWEVLKNQVAYAEQHHSRAPRSDTSENDPWWVYPPYHRLAPEPRALADVILPTTNS